jgi:hypothetical protein
MVWWWLVPGVDGRMRPPWLVRSRLLEWRAPVVVVAVRDVPGGSGRIPPGSADVAQAFQSAAVPAGKLILRLRLDSAGGAGAAPRRLKLSVSGDCDAGS